MCGIAGLATAEPDVALSVKAFLATRALHHRGPDETRFLNVSNGSTRLIEADGEPVPADIVAGACRLSIVDIAGGHQPLANETSSVWVTFNGEIYNQLELRAELESLGHRFRTKADTEVLVHGWEEWETGLLPRLNGVFAFAIIDLRTREVVLARDPLGVKPLFVGVSSGSTWWCSELSAAAAAGLCTQELSADALRLFLTFRFVPSPFAVWQSAWKLPPASYVRLRPDDVGRPPRFERYTPEVRSSLEPRSQSEWQEALMEELEQAVTRQLMSDVPVASLLSGGIDSTLMTLLMTEHLAEPPQTFGVGFASDEGRSEAVTARLAAQELGVPHHSKTLLDAEYERAWPSVIARMGEPTGNTSSAVLHSICVEVGKSHKVGLCGQGADELLGGYPRHVAERLYPLGCRAPALAGAVASGIYRNGAGPRLTRIFRTRDRIDRYVDIFAHVTPEDADQLAPGGAATTRELARAVIAGWTTDETPEDPLNDLLRVDARVSLADDLLIVADLCSMYESVELRVPFLDLAFVNLAERMPSRYKIGSLGNRKWLYRKAAAARLPAATSRRLFRSDNPLKRKRGFSPPRNNRLGGVGAGRRDDAGWLKPLLDVEAFDRDALSLAVSGRHDLARGRSILLALSRWLAVQEVQTSEKQVGEAMGSSHIP